MAFLISGLSTKLKKSYAFWGSRFTKGFLVLLTSIKEKTPAKEQLKELLNCFLPFNPDKNFPGYIALALALTAGSVWASHTVPASGHLSYNLNSPGNYQSYRDITGTGNNTLAPGEETFSHYPGVIPAAENKIAPAETYRDHRPGAAQVSRSWINRSDVYLMARVIEGEAADEPFVGKVAVGAVIMNRIESKQFPYNVKQVVYQPLAFEAVQNGQYLRPLTDDSVKAAHLAVKGWDPTDGALYYWNPVTAKSKWVWQRPIMMTIGRHVFAR